MRPGKGGVVQGIPCCRTLALLCLFFVALMTPSPSSGLQSMGGEELERVVARLIQSDGAGAARAELLGWTAGVGGERADPWLRLVAALDLLPPEAMTPVIEWALEVDQARFPRSAPTGGAPASPVPPSGADGSAPDAVRAATARASRGLEALARELEEFAPDAPRSARPGGTAGGAGSPAPGEPPPEGTAHPVPALLSLAATFAAMDPPGEAEESSGASRARTLFLEVATEWPRDPRAPEAALEAARRVPPQEAREILDAFLIRHPSHPLAPEARRLRSRLP